MDDARICAVGPKGIPSIAMACEADASSRETVRLTWEEEFRGQSTFNAKRVEITNAPGFFWLVSPKAEVPL
jgi:hypothetical protein